MKNELNNVQQQQVQTLTRIDGTGQDVEILKSNLTVTRNDLGNIFDSFDQKLNSTQEKQLELDSRIRDHGHGNKQRIDNLEEKLNNTQEIQLELTSQIRNHGHGNKQRIDTLESQLTNFKINIQTFDQDLKTLQQKQTTIISKEDVLDRRMNVLWTNITYYMNQIERQAIENITDLSSQINTTNSVRPSRI